MVPRYRDDGLSEVIGFVLLLGLIVVVFSLYVTYAVPAEGREIEIQHMNEVKTRFTAYKESMDTLWMNAPENPTGNSGTYGVTMSTSFDLGTIGTTTQGGVSLFPMLSPIGSSGTMIIDGSDGTLTITRNSIETLLEAPLGSIRYNSANNYWVQQDYYYQMGGVFLSQQSGVINKISPTFTIYNLSDIAAIQITPIRINGDQYITGSGSIRLDSRLQIQPQYYDIAQGAQSIKVEVDVGSLKEAKAWKRVFDDSATMNNVPSSWYETGYTGDESSGNAYIDIDGPESGTGVDVKIDIFRADYIVSLQNVATEIT